MVRVSSIRAATVTGVLVVLAAIVPGTAPAAAGCPNEQVRSETHSTQLPDCRSYELVTPPFKDGVSINSVIWADASHIFGGSLGTFSGAEVNTGGAIGVEHPFGVEYELARGEGGWAATPVPPPPTAQFVSAGMQQDVGADRAATLWKMSTPSQPEGEGDLYRRESDGSYVHLGPLQPASVVPLFGQEGIYAGASEGFRHVLIKKAQNQGRWPGDTTSGSESIYEYGGADEPEPLLVGVKNEGRLASNTEAQLISQCGTALGSGLTGSAYNAISPNGSVFFTALECGEPSVNELYARIDEAHTVAISEPVLPAGECTGTCETAEYRPGVFLGASEDGSKAFFMTEQPLLNKDKDTTKDLYMAELEGASVKRLVMLSEGETAGAPSENDQTPGEGASVAGVVKVSTDGSHVYFVANGVLTGAANGVGAKAEAGADNLYATDTVTGHTSFVAQLAEQDGALWAQVDALKQAAVTPDGHVLVLVTHADLTGEEGIAGEQLYKYETQSGSVTRLSIGQHSNQNRLAPKIPTTSYFASDELSEAHSHLTMSKDGSYVFFESPDALTPNALDDQIVGCFYKESGVCLASYFAANVYEYHEGHVSLIVTARVPNGRASLHGTDETGTNVFFATAESLVGSDTDTQEDIYDARVNGGGFPANASPGCSGEACRALTAPLPLAFPASIAQTGGDNLVPSPKVVVKTKSRPATRARKLAVALKACKARPRRKRHGCEATARKRFGSTINTEKSPRRGK